ncbi:transposase [Eubacterium sp. 1001713B170207_170306_E7]|uniref:transposase n=1 Tax=Eubacterium sp. 1001713B170207_170306_E7 TaxID=2787097 RepID=UPI00189C4A9B|nr:transposase [Eubacterium sp. 1001713B170207_170306_E7]
MYALANYSEINRLTTLLPEYPVVMAISGVGESLGSQLMGEIGDPLRFKHKQTLDAFASADSLLN